MSHMSCKARTLAISFDSDPGSFASGDVVAVYCHPTEKRISYSHLKELLARTLTVHCLRNSHTLEGAHTNANWFHM